MDKLMKQALDKHKIVRYIPTFVDVLKTYKTLLEAETQALHQPLVSGAVCRCGNPIGRTECDDCLDNRIRCELES